MAFSGQNAGLLFKIDADPSGAVRALNQVDRNVNQLSGSATGLTSSFSSLINPAALVAAGITAIATAAVAGTAALFNLSKAAGEYGDQIFDTAQKTNVSTDAIQAFNFAAEQSGSSVEVVNKSLARFSTLLGQAANGNEKAQAILKQYGITATDTDEALQQAIESIMKMTDENQQNAAAAELFKDRGGNVINMLREMNGDLPGTIQKLKDMGIMMGKEDVEAAARFTDQMDLLDKQLAGVGRTIGTEVLPVFMEFATDLSAWLKENPDLVKAWGDAFKNVLFGVIAAVKLTTIGLQGLFDTFASFARAVGVAAAGGGILGVTSIYDQYAQRQAERFAQGGNILSGQARTLPPAATAGGGGGGFRPGTADDEKAEADKRRQVRDEAARRELSAQKEHVRLQLQNEREGFQDSQKNVEQAFLDRKISEDQFIKESESDLEVYSARAKKLLLDAFKLDAQGKTPAEIVNLRLAKDLANKAIDAEIAREREDRAKLVTATNKENDAERKKAVDHWNKAREAQKDIYDIQKQGIDDGAKDRESQIDFWNKRREEQKRIYDLQADGDKSKADQEKEDRDRQRQKILNTTVGSGSEISAIGQLQDYFAGEGNAAALIGIETLSQAFAGLGQAIGEVVHAWVLYGSAGQSVRQVTAQILAGIAQQAAVKAIFELAEGFAALALAFFGIPNAGPSASAHFTAAAIYGSIAGVAALAGRAVAGDSFKKATPMQGGGVGPQGSGQGSGANQGTVYSSYGDEQMIKNVIRPGPQTIILQVRSNDSHIVEVVQNDVSRNGPIRATIRDLTG